MSILNIIVSGNYAATPKQVEELARAVHVGLQGPGTYLRILVCACLSALPELPKHRGRRAIDTVAQLAAVDKVHVEHYPAVLRGVADDSTDTRENNRRATFARSAASTLRAYVKRGGDIRSLDVDQVTKAGLRGAEQPEGVTDRLATAWVRSQKALVKMAKDLLADNPEFATEAIDATIEALRELLEEAPTPRVVGAKLHRRAVREGPRAAH